MTKREMAEMYQRRANELKAEADAEEKAQLDAQKYKSAYETAYNAFFDGLKYVHSPEQAFPLELPMNVKANMYYRDESGVLYVAVQTGEVTVESFKEFMEPMEI